MLQEKFEPQYTPVFAHVRNSEDFRRVFRQRAMDLLISRAAIDDIIGWSPGYAGKVLAEFIDKELRVRTVDEMSKVLGLEFIAVDTPASIELSKKLCSRFPKRDESQCRWNNRASRAGKEAKGATRAKNRRKRAA